MEQPPPQESRCCNAAAPQNRIVAMLHYCNAASHCRNARIVAMPQRIAAIPVSMLVLPQYCRNADAACNALQHCRNTYCRNIEAHCRNAPFVASLRQCCYCKGHCGNALWHCYNTLIFSRCMLCTGMDEARALVRALCNSSVSRVSLLCSMFQCFHFLVKRGHARGMRLGTWPVYATCGVAFITGVTSAGWRCPKTLYAQKQRNGVIQNNTLFLQTNS